MKRKNVSIQHSFQYRMDGTSFTYGQTERRSSRRKINRIYNIQGNAVLAELPSSVSSAINSPSCYCPSCCLEGLHPGQEVMVVGREMSVKFCVGKERAVYLWTFSVLAVASHEVEEVKEDIEGVPVNL